jgi:hypothetical protein
VRRCLIAASALALLATAGGARAQTPAAAPVSLPVGDWQLSPVVELRTRGEYRRDAPDMAGVDVPGNASSRVRNAYGVLERTRLGLGAEYGAARGDPGLLRAQVTLQDARAWGAPSPSGILGAEGSGASSIGAYEAWVEVRTSAARPAFLRVGRQAVTWGDGRLVSNADWSPVARTLDAARGHASAGLFDFEVLAAMLDTPTPLGPSFGDRVGPSSTGSQLYGAQVGLFLSPLLRGELSLLARVSRGSAADTARFSLARAEGETYVGSLRVFGDGSGWRYAVEGAYELGRAELLADTKVAAWAAAGYVEKKLEGVALTPTLRLEADYASGDDGGSTYRQFDPLLPDVHTLHGGMDLLSWSNTAEASARVSAVPWAEGRVAVEYRYARLAESTGEWLDGYLGVIGHGRAGTELGHEVDAWTSWRPWPVLELSLGYSLFVVGDGARAILKAVESSSVTANGTIEPASLAHFGCVQATLRVP